MPNGKDLAFPADVEYIYDGTIEGLLCCVHESVYAKELPFSISPEDQAEPSLMEQRYIESDITKYKKVRSSIIGQFTPRAMDLVEAVFLSCLEQREIAILNFLLFAYKTGPKTVDMLGHPIVAKLLKAERHLFGECHLLLGFVRFSDYGGKLAAVITPKNFVLPFIARHFISRFSQEDFLIFDKTHKAALVYQNREAQIIDIDHLEFLPADETEETYRKLWRQFYKTIAIKERYNPKCRMTHMPKRYWENMTEMNELL